MFNFAGKNLKQMKDLFEYYQELPQEVKDILELCEEMDCTYDNCRLLIEKLNTVGYTCDYGLDASPYDLRKL